MREQFMATLTGTITKGSLINGDFSANCNLDPAKMGLTLRDFAVPLSRAVIYTSLQPLPSTSSGSDLGFTAGTWATNTPKISSGDVKAAGTTTRYALMPFILPDRFAPGGTVTVKLMAGMETTVAGTSCSLDLEVYLADDAGGITGSDLCATAAQDMNSLTSAEFPFTLTTTNLVAGSQMWARIKISAVDAATATAVIANLYKVLFTCQCRG